MGPLVLHVITGLGVGGAERTLARTIASAGRYRHQVIALSALGPMADEIAGGGVPVMALEAGGGMRSLPRLARLRAEISDRNPALIQSWLVHSNIAAALMAPAKTPLVWNVRHTLEGFENERRSTRLLLRASTLASRRAQTIVYNSQRAAVDHEAIGYPSSRRVVIPNGFMVRGRTSAERAKVRRSLGLATDDVAVGLVARVHPIKNHRGFLAAARQIASEAPRARFLLAGAGTAAGDELEREFGSEFGARMLWLGERADIADVTGALDIACNVSHGEAFSNTLGEAMAAGVPCVATDVGDSAEIIGDTGWLARGVGSGEIADALRDALLSSPEARADRGRRARTRIEREFSLGAAAARYEALYDRILDNHGPRAIKRK